MTSHPAGHAKTTPVEAPPQGDRTRAAARVVAALVLEGTNVGVTAARVEAMIGAVIEAVTTGRAGRRIVVLGVGQTERAASGADRC